MYVLGYWKIRGLAAPIRMLCAYTGDALDEEFYTDREVWKSKKQELSSEFSFINLPYFYDKDENGNIKIKLTQSMAILRYIAKKHDLVGKTEEEQSKVDMVLEEIRDVYMSLTRMCYNPSFDDAMKKTFLETIPVKLQMLETFMDSDWIVGSSITMCDFFLWHTLEAMILFEPTIFDAFPRLKAYLDRFEAIPAIKSYMESDKFLHWPLNGASAKFGGSGDDPKK